MSNTDQIESIRCEIEAIDSPGMRRVRFRQWWSIGVVKVQRAEAGGRLANIPEPNGRISARYEKEEK